MPGLPKQVRARRALVALFIASPAAISVAWA
jgi:hypothetical protein